MKTQNSVVFLSLYEFPSAVECKIIYWEQYLVTKQLLHDFHSMKNKKYTIRNLVMNILQNILFYVEVNKEIHS